MLSVLACLQEGAEGVQEPAEAVIAGPGAQQQLQLLGAGEHAASALLPPSELAEQLAAQGWPAAAAAAAPLAQVQVAAGVHQPGGVVADSGAAAGARADAAAARGGSAGNCDARLGCNVLGVAPDSAAVAAAAAGVVAHSARGRELHLLHTLDDGTAFVRVVRPHTRASSSSVLSAMHAHPAYSPVGDTQPVAALLHLRIKR